jgi:molybdopterin synthase sulfur carrier subunit
MQVHVRFFASLRDATGTDGLPVTLADGADLVALLGALQQALGPAADALQAENVRVAVNHELVSAPRALRDGDEVAFLPPVTGG